MAYTIKLKTVIDNNGTLTVFDRDIPFTVKRIFYIYNVNDTKIVRGGHRHKKTRQALICLKGQCIIYNNDGFKKQEFILNSPNECLILEPEDYHTMHDFSKDAILLVLASEHYDRDDYIDMEYNND
jgi:dTDP-4-dehydrorhamnose 3,5-epimerase-like enzyme